MAPDFEHITFRNVKLVISQKEKLQPRSRSIPRSGSILPYVQIVHSTVR